jgi:hypothetical protein
VVVISINVILAKPITHQSKVSIFFFIIRTRDAPFQIFIGNDTALTFSTRSCLRLGWRCHILDGDLLW